MSEPQTTPAASILKKAQRLSIAGSSRSLGTSRGPIGTDSSKRRSTLLSTPASNKRLSIHGSGGPVVSSNTAPRGYELEAQPTGSSSYPSQVLPSTHSQTGTSTGTQRKADLRPLREKYYQTLISKEIYDFCIGNRFELEMNHPITLKTLKHPTQKDFVCLFKFLYCKLDPNHKFVRSVESDVFNLLKSLSYPFLDGINRSSISAVGGQNWPVFLGMLYWLVKENLNLSNLNEEYLVANAGDLERISMRYISRSYAAFIEQKDNFSEFFEEAKQEHDIAESNLSAQVQEKDLHKQELGESFDKISAQYGELEEAKAKSNALENDFKQFSEYMFKVKERQAQWRSILDQVENDIADAASRLESSDAQKKTLENTIKEKGFSVSEIDSLDLERDRVAKIFDTISNKISDLKESMVRKDADVHQSIQSLQSFVDQYNVMTAKIPWGENAVHGVVINSLLEGEGQSAFEPDSVLNLTMRNEKIRLLEVKSKLKQELLRIQEETIKVVDQSDQVREKIVEQQNEIESCNLELKRLKDLQDEIYETMVSEDAIRSAQSEKLDRDLQAMRIQSNKGVIEVETRNKALKIQLKETRYNLEQQRERLHARVYSFLQEVISFKLNIQGELEGLEAITSQELDAQLQRSSLSLDADA